MAGILIYLARNIILRKKTSYDEAKLDSKKDRDFEKYHSDWSEEEIFGSRKSTTDASVALKGTMAPAGDYKGFGMGLFVEIMSACSKLTFSISVLAKLCLA